MDTDVKILVKTGQNCTNLDQYEKFVNIEKLYQIRQRKEIQIRRIHGNQLTFRNNSYRISSSTSLDIPKTNKVCLSSSEISCEFIMFS